jgi:hypothetical protein
MLRMLSTLQTITIELTKIEEKFMAKGHDAKKSVKKKSEKTLKEKRKEKKEKKAQKR